MWAVQVTNRAEFGDIVRNLLHEIEQLDVEVRTGVIATAETVLAERPDAVIIATGSIPDGATIPGAEGSGVADVTDILSGQVKPGKRGAGDRPAGIHEATSTAEYMAEQGCEVEVVTPRSMSVRIWVSLWTGKLVSAGATAGHQMHAQSFGAEHPGRRSDGTAQLQRPARQFPQVDTIVLAIHRKADSSLYEAEGRVPDLHRIGDCVAPRRLMPPSSKARKRGGLSDGETHRCGGRNRTCRRTDSIDARMCRRGA